MISLGLSGSYADMGIHIWRGDIYNSKLALQSNSKNWRFGDYHDAIECIHKHNKYQVHYFFHKQSNGAQFISPPSVGDQQLEVGAGVERTTVDGATEESASET